MAARKLTDEQRREMGVRIKAQRHRAGLTRPELARKAGWSHESISAAELGNYGTSLPAIMDLIVALGCTWNDVLGPPAGGSGADADYEAGYRAGVGDAVAAVRALRRTNDEH